MTHENNTAIQYIFNNFGFPKLGKTYRVKEGTILSLFMPRSSLATLGEKITTLN